MKLKETLEIENSRLLMMTMQHPKLAAKPDYVKANTGVWWDINTCPIPDGYDARRVRPSIESALKNLGYSGPVEITVIGCLEDTSENVLRGLSSTGIYVKHGRAMGLIYDLFSSWQTRNPPPASMMFITDNLEHISLSLVHQQQRKPGYNLLRAYTRIPKFVSVLYTTAEWLWESLLATPATDEMDMDSKQETRILSSVLRKCLSSSFILPQQHLFYCSTCRFATGSLPIFTTHLSGEEHKEQEIDLARSRLPDPGGYNKNQAQVEENPPMSKHSKKRVRPARAPRAP